MMPQKWSNERNVPFRRRLATSVSLLLVAVLPSLPCYGAPAPRVIAATRVQIDDSDVPVLRKLVESFAASHGFGDKEEFTMPPHRKVFLVPGAFSTSYTRDNGYYLGIHNLVGKSCVVIQLYGDTPLPDLMPALRTDIKKALPEKSKFVDSKTCGDSD